MVDMIRTAKQGVDYCQPTKKTDRVHKDTDRMDKKTRYEQDDSLSELCKLAALM